MANLPVGTTIYGWHNLYEDPTSVYTINTTPNLGDSVYNIYGEELAEISSTELYSTGLSIQFYLGSNLVMYDRDTDDTTSTTVQVKTTYISNLSDGTNTYVIKDAEARTALSGKQDTLVSGTSIKTINNESILGSGNIIISSGSDVEAYTVAEIQSIWEAN